MTGKMSGWRDLMELLLAKARFQMHLRWLIWTGRGHRTAPQSLEDKYNRIVELEHRQVAAIAEGEVL